MRYNKDLSPAAGCLVVVLCIAVLFAFWGIALGLLIGLAQLIAGVITG